MRISSKIFGIAVVAAFAAGSFLASPELRAFAADTVGSADIIDGSIQSIDIGNAQVKLADLAGNSVNSGKVVDNSITAADIGVDAVGASEIQGVTKLSFGQCALTDTQMNTPVNAGSLLTITCNITGVDGDDNAFAMVNNVSPCFSASQAGPSTGKVFVELRNNCDFAQTTGKVASIAVLVYDK